MLATCPMIAERRATKGAAADPAAGGAPAIRRAVSSRAADPRSADRIVYELLRSRGPGEVPTVIGEAAFSGGTISVMAEENVAVAIRELLERPFVDRIQADERPRGYRRSRIGQVDLVVAGSPEN